MNVAIHNPHLGPNIYDLGIHNYIIDLIKDGHIPYIFIDGINKNYIKSALRSIIKGERIDWGDSKFIFSQKELNSKCDVLISFNTHLREGAFSRAVRNFDGLKVWHVGDYFWNEAGSIINKRLLDHGVSHVMGYSSHDKHCRYFQKTFAAFKGRVLPIPFGYSERFKSNRGFASRLNKSVALGSVNPLRPLNFDVRNFRESADFYPDEAWFHRSRRKLILNKGKLTSVADIMLPEFPSIKDFKYDLVKKFNKYKMFTSCESIFYFPPAKTYEGSACGSVNICINHDCNKEFGFEDGVNCIMYNEGDVDDYIQKVEHYQNNSGELEQISLNARQHAYNNFRHKVIAENIVESIANIYTTSDA